MARGVDLEERVMMVIIFGFYWFLVAFGGSWDQ
jgi:hypothetical protein